MKKQLAVAAFMLASACASPSAWSDPLVGELQWVGFNFAPQGWHFCDGSLLPIADNETLFSLLGTTYGGDGIQTFGLPNFQGRLMVSTGDSVPLGETAGTEAVTLTESQMPAHRHALVGSIQKGNTVDPAGGLPARASVVDPNNPTNTVQSTVFPYRTAEAAGAATGQLASGAVTSTGGGQPISNISPYLTMNCIISLYGIYPTQQ